MIDIKFDIVIGHHQRSKYASSKFRKTGKKNGDVWETFGNSILLLSYIVLTWVGIIFVKILHLAFTQCKIMTNIMPTHVKISIELGIRELFLKQELLIFSGTRVYRIDWLDPCCPYFYFPELWFVCCLSLYCVMCPVSCVQCPVSCVLCPLPNFVSCHV